MMNTHRSEYKGSGLGVRHVQFLLLFCALTLESGIESITSNLKAIPDEFFRNQSSYRYLTLNSGYMIGLVSAALLSHRFGGKVIILTSVSVFVVIDVLTPIFVKWESWKLLCAMLWIQGAFRGFFGPSCHTLIAAWAPQKERATMGNFIYAGTQFGVIVFILAFALVAYFDEWLHLYYASGGVGSIFVVFYYIWGASSPSECRRISPEERELIELGQAREIAVTSEEELHRQSIPWRSLFTSPAVWALIAVQSADVVGFTILASFIPSFMTCHGVSSFLHFIVFLLLSFSFAWLSKKMQRIDSISLSFNRKFFNSIGTWGPMVLLYALVNIEEDQYILAQVFFILAYGISSAVKMGYFINHIDLSPNYAGILMGICQSISSFVSWAFILNTSMDTNDWRLVFIGVANILLIGNIVFLVFGRTDVQPWNNSSANVSKNSVLLLETYQERTI